jgi:hypothetical protein
MTKKDKHLFSIDRERHDIIDELARYRGTSLSNLIDDDVVIVDHLVKMNPDSNTY